MDDQETGNIKLFVFLGGNAINNVLKEDFGSNGSDGYGIEGYGIEECGIEVRSIECQAYYPPF